MLHGRVAGLRCLVALTAARSAEPVASVSSEGLKMPTQEYFDEYGSLYDHVTMLQDFERMSAYYDAIKLNAAEHFRDKVVLDVGAGTGILSIWAAQAGARHVYAVEATSVAKHARKLVAAHHLSETVTVLNGKMEDVMLPEQVDCIVSEWMGYFLLRESMVQSVLAARDRWLKPGGVMYPSHARLLVAPLEEAGFLSAREAEVTSTQAIWDELTGRVAERYEIDLSALAGAYRSDNV